MVGFPWSECQEAEDQHFWPVNLTASHCTVTYFLPMEQINVCVMTHSEKRVAYIMNRCDTHG